MITVATRNNALCIAKWLTSQGAIVAIAKAENGWRLNWLIMN